MICTWEGCGDTAKHPQKDKVGALWANLCDVHNELLQDAIDRADAKALLSRWVRAQGGAKVATKRMINGKR